MRIKEIAKGLEEIKSDKTVALVEQAIEDGLDPVDIMQEGIIAGLQEVGKKFGSGEYFLAELMMAGKLGETCMEIITPHLPEITGAKKGVVVIQSVKDGWV
jgi:5-methyltetrahydrofolate--homocysteine methyltransferase